MRLLQNKEEVYDWCITGGNLTELDTIELAKVKANLEIIEGDLTIVNDALSKKIWNTLYKLEYDILHVLIESFLCFDKVKSKNHRCLFTYLCVKHPELELDWGFFEKVRTKRNGINYYGKPVNEKDWKEVALQFNLYIKLLKEEVEKKLNNSN